MNWKYQLTKIEAQISASILVSFPYTLYGLPSISPSLTSVFFLKPIISSLKSLLFTKCLKKL